ncbi:unnamed protein product [Rangifer tarandus platyrhynchus]|uniref:Rhodanese domain-containing protein n=2 Tax=Rangifer tarandus platyrhynchus TaxID=3082113 RepID=A0ABN8ZIE0_RANTA|nr:unnamed protein product [Rangifer tarandus platyrhynchus]CAI9708205.1 unnamed protein product [Rangifer tarandus platyrhynchus]
MWPLEPMEHPQWRRSELESDLQIEPAAFKALFSSEKPKPEDENLIFFCQMGKRGLQATQVAQSLGYEGARNYEGAYREWFQKEGWGEDGLLNAPSPRPMAALTKSDEGADLLGWAASHSFVHQKQQIKSI